MPFKSFRGEPSRRRTVDLRVVQRDVSIHDLITLSQAAALLGLPPGAGHQLLWKGAARGQLEIIRPGWAYLTTRDWALAYLRSHTDYEAWVQRPRLWEN